MQKVKQAHQPVTSVKIWRTLHDIVPQQYTSALNRINDILCEVDLERI